MGTKVATTYATLVKGFLKEKKYMLQYIMYFKTNLQVTLN